MRIPCLALTVIGLCASVKAQEVTTDTATTSASVPITRPYEVVETEDISYKAVTRSLSSYTPAELTALPMNKKICYRVVLPSDIREAEVRPTMEKAVAELSAADPDIDELMILAYSDKEISGGAYDVASATWAPGGKLGNVTPEIASTNDKSNHLLTLQVKDGLEAYLKNRNSDEERHGYSEAQRKQLFARYVAIERFARDEADKYFPYDKVPREKVLEVVGKNSEHMEAVKAQNVAKFLEAYKLTQEQLDSIVGEGILKNWPTI